LTFIVASFRRAPETISRVDSDEVQSPAMKPRNLRRWIALVALGAQVLVPFAAYASAHDSAVFGDVCSVVGKVQKSAPASTVAPVGLPAQRSDHHGAEHCAFCPGGAANAALLPPALPTLQAQAQPVIALRVNRVAPATLLLLLPPSRAPPSAA
jgi:Protein of unknown function (DUF2946)